MVSFLVLSLYPHPLTSIFIIRRRQSTYLDEWCCLAHNAVDLANPVFSQQRAQLRGDLVQREAEWEGVTLENEIILGEVDFGRLSADRDAGLQNEQVVEVSGVQLAEREFHLLLSHRETEVSSGEV